MKRILIIEDETEIAEMMRDILAEENFACDFVGDGNVGIQKAIDERPDLIVLDLALLGRDGFSVCRTLKENKATAQIPIVVYTGHTKVGQAQEILKAGGDVYISKLTPISKLVEVIKEYTQDT